MPDTIVDRVVCIVVASTVFTVVLIAALLTPTSARADGPYASWAAVVVAGDWHAHGGGQSEAFDNARRDVVRDLVGIGFQPSHIRQFSARSQYYEGTLPADDSEIHHSLRELSREATGGCLVYFTSHGGPEGILVGRELMSPREMSDLLDDTCGDRSTVVVLSACFSGVFVPKLQSPSRMVLTAARPDRSSFGCGEADKYPYFDTCFLAEFPRASDFPGLGREVQNCVARRERETGAAPPSEPQLSIGGAVAQVLRTYSFPRAEQRGESHASNSNSTRTSTSTCSGNANSIAHSC